MTAPIYRDPNQPIAARVEDLLARMTVEEKVAQLGSLWVYEVADGPQFDPARAAAKLGQGIGQITRSAGGSQNRAGEVAHLNNMIQRYLIESTRLGIPAIIHEECCAGFLARGATIFPQILGVASTWQPELVEAMARAIGGQMRAVGAHQGLSPVLDVVRDPRWGRVEETFGEDPYLATQLGTAYVRGLQGKALADDGIIATAKHFAGYGVTEGGLNWAPTHINPRELREVFLMPFEAAVREARLGSVMNGYHELDGIPCAANRALFTDLLRGEWGFGSDRPGFVVSDYSAIDMLRAFHYVAPDKAAAAVEALTAGIDIELPQTDCYGQPLLDAIAAGRISMEIIDQAVRRVLYAKFALGLFEHPYVDEGAAAVAFDTTADRVLARRVAQQSIVLLKNEGGLLPLSKQLKRIAVIGPSAHSLRLLNGDYHYPAHLEIMSYFAQLNLGEGPVVLPKPAADADPMQAEEQLYAEHFTPMVSVLRGIQAAVSPQTQVVYARGCAILGDDTSGFAEAVAAAQGADVAVVVVGEQSGLTPESTCGEFRDRAFLDLPGVQEALVKAIVATGTPTVVVLISGRPNSISWLDAHVPAIVEAWVPGEEGGNAIADVLFGDVNPGGRLAMSVPRSVGQVPVFYNHKPSGGRSMMLGDYVDLSVKPLYPFGHGLSYTTFAYENLRITPMEVAPTGQVTIAVDVTNRGARAGDEVVQLYLRDPQATVTRPVQELKGFCRLTLQPGETRTVVFTVDARQMAFYDREMRYVVEPGAIEVMVGASSADIRLRGQFTIVGATTLIDRKVFASQVAVE